jgi:hypothetical protein
MNGRGNILLLRVKVVDSERNNRRQEGTGLRVKWSLQGIFMKTEIPVWKTVQGLFDSFHNVQRTLAAHVTCCAIGYLALLARS